MAKLLGYTSKTTCTPDQLGTFCTCGLLVARTSRSATAQYSWIGQPCALFVSEGCGVVPLFRSDGGTPFRFGCFVSSGL